MSDTAPYEHIDDLKDEVECIDSRLTNAQRQIFETLLPTVEDLEDRVHELEAENERLRERLEATSGKQEKIESIVEFAVNKRSSEPITKVTWKEITGATGVSKRYAFDLIDPDDGLPAEFEWLLVEADLDRRQDMDTSGQLKSLYVDFDGVHSNGLPVNKFITESVEKGAE